MMIPLVASQTLIILALVLFRKMPLVCYDFAMYGLYCQVKEL
jgi:hypothetical protein